MEAQFCSNCNEKIIEDSILCKYCGTLARRSEEHSSIKKNIAKPQKSKFIILIAGLILIVIIVFIFLRSFAL
jgi:uncharacterized membrane protein YvbJ